MLAFAAERAVEQFSVIALTVSVVVHTQTLAFINMALLTVFNTVLYYESTPSTPFRARITGGFAGFSPIEDYRWRSLRPCMSVKCETFRL
jgi:hypothetical protein